MYSNPGQLGEETKGIRANVPTATSNCTYSLFYSQTSYQKGVALEIATCKSDEKVCLCEINDVS
jgi:hypothetical protein